MGGYYENIRGEIVHYTCKKCFYFRHDNETGDDYCRNSDRVIDVNNGACGKFIRESED